MINDLSRIHESMDLYGSSLKFISNMLTTMSLIPMPKHHHLASLSHSDILSDAPYMFTFTIPVGFFYVGWFLQCKRGG